MFPNDKDVAILKRRERAILRATGGVKLMNRKNIGKLMAMLGLTVNKKGSKSTEMVWACVINSR